MKSLCQIQEETICLVCYCKPYKGAILPYPPDLIEPCILAGSEEGDTVLDPFMGRVQAVQNH